MTTYAIVHALQRSLKSHIETWWQGDVYNVAGVLVSDHVVPDEVADMLYYLDKNGDHRYLGPATVAIGRVQANVTNLANEDAVPSAFIEIAPNDFDEVENWRHSIYQAIDSAQNIDGNNYRFEISGSHKMHRRLIVKLTIFFLDSDQSDEEVDRLGNAAGAFLESLCTSNTVMGHPWSWRLEDEHGEHLRDPLGEAPWRALPVIVHSRRRGGPPDNYIWDVKIYVEVQCFKETP